MYGHSYSIMIESKKGVWMNNEIVKAYYDISLSLVIVILVFSLIVFLLTNISDIIIGLIILLDVAFYCILVVFKYFLILLKVFEWILII
jgi:hypothetical protein